MTIKEAASILGVSRQDDARIIKQKFRTMMREYHPDAVGLNELEYNKKAQLINEAYVILRKNAKKKKTIPTPVWKARVVENTFTLRIIYMILWEEQKKEYIEVTRGRYEWDPDLEEFDCLIKSLNQAVIELLEGIEHQNNIYHDYEDEIKGLRFPYQVRLFHELAGQYILPVSCLNKMVEPIKIDEQKRSIFKFSAFLWTEGDSKIYRAMLRLKNGDLLYPNSFQNNRIIVSDGSGISLGHLSFAEDYLYYVIIPIIRKHLAQVKLVVNASQVKRNTRPYAILVCIDLFLRMEKMEELQCDSDQNLKITQILNSYDSYLKDR